MKIRFLGTGSGWGVMIRQERGTGGIWIEMKGRNDNEKIIIDPGPGFLLRAKEYGIDPSELTGVLISHTHTDHSEEANVAIEAMSLGHNGKFGSLLAGHNVLVSSDSFTQAVSEFHKNLPEHVVEMAPSSKASVGKIEVFATKTAHYEPKCVGFVLDGEKRIGYTADGAYYVGMGSFFENCDILIINNFLPRGLMMPGHMNTDMAAMLLAEAKPKKAVITHFGREILDAGPDNEAAFLQDITGIHVIAAEDEMEID
ncbi:MAG: MBL fold metallo-hydrolase [Candidatus Micrarchaeota archaeon]|nr:MBL fold metallo-hydrolase [Candidatus Micrarchaeota archaeon]